MQYLQSNVKGTYSITKWAPKENIRTRVPAVMITLGFSVKITKNIGGLFQANLGGKSILWYVDGKQTETLWRYYLPINLGLEYALKKGWNLVGGVSLRAPIYISQTTKLYFGIRKIL